MKTFSKISFAIALAALVLPAQAQFIQSPTVIEALTLTPYPITASSITNIPSTNQVAVQIPKNSGVSFLTRFAAAGAGSSPLRFTFGVSQDGTNYSTLPVFPVATFFPFEFATAPNGTAQVVDFTNWSPNVLNNVKWIKLLSISNTTAQVIGVTNASFGIYR